MRTLSADALREAVGRNLTDRELDAVMARRDLIVQQLRRADRRTRQRRGHVRVRSSAQLSIAAQILDGFD